MSKLSYTLPYCLLAILVVVPSRGLAEPRAPSAPAASSEYLTAVQAAVDAYNEHRLTDARAHFERAHALKPSARTWHGLGLCSFELGHFEQAADELQTALDDTRAPLAGDVRDEAIAMVRSAQQRRELAALSLAAGTPPPTEATTAEGAGPDLVIPTTHDDDKDSGSRSWWSRRNVIAVSVGAAGALAVLVGAGFGVRSMREGNTRDKYCDAHRVCSDVAGVRAAERAIDAGTISTIAWAVGGAALVGAGVVWWTGRRARRESPSTASVLLGPGALKLRAVW
ncbi:MAG: hypothetical protein RLZZ450_505 [Pseudomonadota bacterium]|jgi:hypothetical protein